MDTRVMGCHRNEAEDVEAEAEVEAEAKADGDARTAAEVDTAEPAKEDLPAEGAAVPAPA